MNEPSPAWDANMECPHERMPFDPCPSPDGNWPHPAPCRCFPIEARAEARVEWGARRYPAAVKREAVAMYGGGASMRIVAGQFGVSDRTVRKWVRGAGLEMRSPGNPEWRKAA